MKFILLLCSSGILSAGALCVRSVFVGRSIAMKSRVASDVNGLTTMRDHSASTWFQPGDAVQVAADVEKMRVNLKGRRGTVLETWEKCEVDPTCCCAEQVDPGMAVRVEFPGSLNDNSGDLSTSFEHYFAEEELTKVIEQQPNNSKETQPFDGMSCVAFKLDHLSQGGQKPRELFSFVPEQAPSDRSDAS